MVVLIPIGWFPAWATSLVPADPLHASEPALFEIVQGREVDYMRAVAHGPRGGAIARGPRGAVARGPHGGVAARGPYGGAAARGPGGNVAVRSGSWARPASYW